MKVEIQKNVGGYQTYEGFQFAKVDREKNTQSSPPKYCKEIFAGMYAPAEFKKRFRFLLFLSHTTLKLDAARTQNFLNQAETSLGFSKSRVWDVSNNAPEGVQALLFDCSTRWAKTSPMLHLLLLLARNGSGHDPDMTWQQTLAKFRRAAAFKPADQAQFLIINDALPHILKKKGRLENFSAMIEERERANFGRNGYFNTRTPEARLWQSGIGICQWVNDLKVAQQQKLVEVDQ